MLTRLKKFFATVDLDYHNSVVNGLNDMCDRANAGRDKAIANLNEASAHHKSATGEVSRLQQEVSRLRNALALAEATSEQRRVALEHEHDARAEAERRGKNHADRYSAARSECDELLRKVSTIESDLIKMNMSLGLSRDRREEIGKSLDNLREATNDTMNFLYRNCNDGSEAAAIADRLADAMNN